MVAEPPEPEPANTRRPRSWSLLVLRLLAVALGSLAVAAVAVQLIPRHPSLKPRDAPHRDELIAARMDPWLLAEGLSERLVVELDWIEGCRPGPASLEGLRRVLDRHGPAGRVVELVLSDEIPAASWRCEEGSGESDPVPRLVAAFASPLVEEGVEHRYALFAPRSCRRSALFGYSTTWNMSRDHGPEVVRGVVVFRQRHLAYRPPWLGVDELELMTLLHEMGHQLGLVADPRHERVSPRELHCTRLDCVMAVPTPRVLARNLPRGLFGVFLKDYCEDCAADIRAAKRHWREQAEADPGWPAAMRRERLAARLALRLVESEEEPERLLREAEEALERSPGSPALESLRLQALLRLDRIDEAALQAGASLRGVPLDGRFAGPLWKHARELIAEGRHEAAHALMAPLLEGRSEPYLFQQSAFIDLHALAGCGRFTELAALASRLLDAAPPRWFLEPQMKVMRADALRRAGRLEEAAMELEPLLALHRAIALEAAAALARAKGEDEEARRLDEERLERPLPDAGPAERAFTRAAVLAGLDRHDEARSELKRGGDAARTAEDSMSEVQRRRVARWRLRAHLALGEVEVDSAAWRGAFQGFPGPCGYEWIDELRRRPDFDEAFPCCLGLSRGPARSPRRRAAGGRGRRR